MTNRWTGGQYSFLRAVLGLLLLWIFLWAPTRPAGALICVFLILGCYHRVAAVAGLLLLAYIHGGFPYFGWVLVAHLLVPPAPYGSIAARGRPDPAGDWKMPEQVVLGAWILLAANYAWMGVLGVRDGTPWMAALVFAPLALVRRARPWLWMTGLAATTIALREPGVAIVHLFTFDPGWIPPRLAASRETMFFDGHCGLCHRSVRFALAEDPHPTTLDFAPLQSGAPEGAGQLDTVVLVTAQGEKLVRSAAVIHMGHRCGGIWRLFAIVVALVPRAIRDSLYDLVARMRHRIFRRPDTLCPVVAPQLRERFRA